MAIAMHRACSQRERCDVVRRYLLRAGDGTEFPSPSSARVLGFQQGTPASEQAARWPRVARAEWEKGRARTRKRLQEEQSSELFDADQRRTSHPRTAGLRRTTF